MSMCFFLRTKKYEVDFFCMIMVLNKKYKYDKNDISVNPM